MPKSFFDVTQENQFVTPDQGGAWSGCTSQQRALFISTDAIISFLTFRNLLPETQFEVFLYFIDRAKPVQSCLNCIYPQIDTAFLLIPNSTRFFNQSLVLSEREDCLY